MKNMTEPIQESQDDDRVAWRPRPRPREPRTRNNNGNRNKHFQASAEQNVSSDMKVDFTEYAQTRYTPIKFPRLLLYVEHAAYSGDRRLAISMTRNLLNDWKNRDDSTTEHLEKLVKECTENPVKSSLFRALAALDRGKPKAVTPKEIAKASASIFSICLSVIKLMTNDNMRSALEEEFLTNETTGKQIGQFLSNLSIMVYECLSTKWKINTNTQCFALAWMALACQKVEDYANNEKFCREGIDMLKDTTTEYETLSRLYQTQGNLHIARTEPYEAEKCLERATAIALKVKNAKRRQELLGYIEKDLTDVRESIDKAERQERAADDLQQTLNDLSI